MAAEDTRPGPGTRHGTAPCTGDHAAGACSGWTPRPEVIAAVTAGRDLDCEFGRRRHRAAYVVGPVDGRLLLACGEHLPFAVQELTLAGRPVVPARPGGPGRIPQVPVRMLPSALAVPA